MKIRPQEAQSTVEYMLILVLVVTLAGFAFKDYLKPAFEKLGNSIKAQIDSGVFAPGFHTFPRK